MIWSSLSIVLVYGVFMVVMFNLIGGLFRLLGFILICGLFSLMLFGFMLIGDLFYSCLVVVLFCPWFVSNV